MVRYLLVNAILILITTHCLHAQTFKWARSIGGNGWDKGLAVTTDSNGNVYAAGIFTDTTDFDTGPGVFNLIPGGGQDIFLTRYDSSGQFIWAKQLGAAGWEECHDMRIDDSGNIYIAGFFLGMSDFDPSAQAFNLSSGPGGDAFICKLKADGSLVWAKQTGGTLAVDARSLAVDKNGNVLMTGYFDGTADFDPGPGSYPLTVSGYSDIFISKWDVAGNFIWVKQLGGPMGEGGYSLSLDDSGNVYSTGTFFGTVDFDPGPGSFPLSSPGQQQEIYLCKLNASGDFAWAKQLGGETGYSVITDHNGHVYATGYYGGLNDIFIHKLDAASGNIIWSKQIGGAIGYSLAVDADADVYATGIFFGTRDFDPGPGTFNLTATGSTDAFISKLDTAGNLVWAKQLGGTNEVFSRSLAMDKAGNIYITGDFDGTADFDPAPALYNLTTTGSYDIFLHKTGKGSLSINPANTAKDYSIYPNPTNTKLFIKFEKPLKKRILTLRKQNGQIVTQEELINTDVYELDIESAAGIYLLEIVEPDAGNRPVITRLVKI